MKAVSQDILSKLTPLISSLGDDTALSRTEIAQLSVTVNQYLKGPYGNFIIKVAEVLHQHEPTTGPSPGEQTIAVHEQWTAIDAVLSRSELDLIDHITKYG